MTASVIFLQQQILNAVEIAAACNGRIRARLVNAELRSILSDCRNIPIPVQITLLNRLPV